MLDQVVTLLFCNLGNHDPHIPGTILQMIIQVPIEDLVVGQKGGTPDKMPLNKLTRSVSPQSTILH